MTSKWGTIEERTAHFLERAHEKHGDKFDYSKFVYVNAKVRSIITCPAHGDFIETPDKHLNTKHACQKCFDELRPGLLKGRAHVNPKSGWKHTAEGRVKLDLDVQEYLAKLNLPTKYKIDMSNYMGSTIGTVTLICPDHGRQTSTPRALIINQYKCTDCAIEVMKSKTTKGYEDFLEYARRVHGDKYKYPYPEEYVNRKSILTLVCPEHGEFKKKVQKHLAGQACFRCKINQLIAEGKLPGGYNEEKFSANPELAASTAQIYYLRVGEYHKIGITKDHLGRRVSGVRYRANLPVTVIDSFDCTLLEAYRYEQTILSDFAEARAFLDWSSEVFYEDVLNGMSIEEYLMLRSAPVDPPAVLSL